MLSITDKVLHAGLKSTPARIGVLSMLSRHDHLSPEQIHLLLERESEELSLSTVYRTLDTLAAAGLIGFTHLNEGLRAYHLAEHQGHTHLTCRDCNKALAVPHSVTESLAKQLADEYGFCMDIDHLAIPGRCTNCVQQRRG